jgi:hypothetical protein
MTDNILGSVRASQGGQAVSKELKDHLDRQARRAKALQEAMDASSAELQAFIESADWGSVLFKGETDWTWLGPGTAGQVLKSNGPDADPEWGDVDTLTVMTPQSTTSGTEKDFTIPSGVKEITVMFNLVSLSGTDDILVQLGDSGGIETTGYESTSTSLAAGIGHVTSSSGFILILNLNGRSVRGTMTIRLCDPSTNTWVANHSCAISAGSITALGGGVKSLSAELTQVRVTRTGTNTFDDGSVNIQYI